MSVCRGYRRTTHRVQSGTSNPAAEWLRAKPSEDGLEAQLDKLIAHTLDIHWADELPIEAAIPLRDKLAAFVRTHQAARERELREKLEVLADDWKARGKGGSEAELRSLLASHWPAQKESGE